MVHGIILDIEGTIAPIAFVRDVLFPYARAHLPALLAENSDDPAVAAELAAIQQLAPGADPLAALLGWMDIDAKVTPLKALQGILWRQGYASGALKAQFYPDVGPTLQDWHRTGHILAIYSSGSIEAQHLLFAHSSDGDLRPLISAWFDTRTGPKRDPASYATIAASLGQASANLLFLSDIAAELDAARAAGLATCQLVRRADGTVATPHHPTAATLPEVASQMSGFHA